VFIPGEEAFGAIHDWLPDPGAVVCWHPSPASLTKVRQAPISAVPASHQQARHLRNFVDHAGRGVDMSRLCIGSWDMPGRCDIRVLTYVINAHLRRHDTYHSWFEFADGDRILRHTVRNPADIQCVAVKHDDMTPEDFRDHIVATPSPLEWDCFRFAVIQRADHFTFCFSIDHLYIDAQFLGAMRMELYLMYTSLLAGGAPPSLPAAGSYEKYCVEQHEYTSELTLESPQVQAWVDFFEHNDGTLPECPVSLGDGSGACDLMFVRLMDEQQTADFESACIAAGGRFSGGVFASAALAQYELTGAETYYGLTPTDKRKSPADFMTVGWFTGVVPFTVPIDPNSFEETARAAQASFDGNMDLANVPFDRVLELAPWLRKHGPQFTMMSYMDAGLPPLSGIVATALDGVNATAFTDGRSPAYMYSTVFRLFDEVSIMVSYPNNPVARESVIRYTEALRSVFARVVAGTLAAVPVRVAR
jgi:hypothetical protein